MTLLVGCFYKLYVRRDAVFLHISPSFLLLSLLHGREVCGCRRVDCSDGPCIVTGQRGKVSAVAVETCIGVFSFLSINYHRFRGVAVSPFT